MKDVLKSNRNEKKETSIRSDTHAALEISGLKQVIGLPGTKETFTLNVSGRLAIPVGAFVGILGQTGCGKTTLLTVLGLLRGATPNSSLKNFSMLFRGDSTPTDLTDIWRQNRSDMANRLRCAHFGFALQHGELLPSLTVAENIAFPLKLNGWSRKRIRNRVDYLIDAFRLYRSFKDSTDDQPESQRQNAGALDNGISSLADARINHLSGGQHQRVALARAVAHQPEFLFVDEPTASLNRSVARIALKQLSNMRAGDGTRSTIFMVTHDERFAKEFCNKIIHMRPVSRKDSSSEDAAGEVVFKNSSPNHT